MLAVRLSSGLSSLSLTAVTVTVCATFHCIAVKVSVLGAMVMMPSPPLRVTVTSFIFAAPCGRLFSATV